MRFIAAKESDLFKLSCTTRKSSSRTTSGAKYIANDRGLVSKATKAFVEDAIETEENIFVNSRLVYVCK